MSEEVKPYPACRNPDIVVTVDTKTAVHCPMCGMYGPCAPINAEEYVIRQWNPLPRALEWTNEPPEGKDADMWFIRKDRRYWELCIITWADTIPTWPYASGRLHAFDLEPHDDVMWYGPIPEPRPHELVGEQEKNDA